MHLLSGELDVKNQKISQKQTYLSFQRLSGFPHKCIHPLLSETYKRLFFVQAVGLQSWVSGHTAVGTLTTVISFRQLLIQPELQVSEKVVHCWYSLTSRSGTTRNCCSSSFPHFECLGAFHNRWYTKVIKHRPQSYLSPSFFFLCSFSVPSLTLLLCPADRPQFMQCHSHRLPCHAYTRHKSFFIYSYKSMKRGILSLLFSLLQEPLLQFQLESLLLTSESPLELDLTYALGTSPVLVTTHPSLLGEGHAQQPVREST